MAAALLESLQALKTSGARGVAPFSLGGVLHLAIPQLAEDVPGQQAGVDAGNSDLPALIYRWSADRFEERFRLPASGAEDVEPFRISGELFLAIANLRTGQGPYDLNVDSVLYRWSGRSFVVHQRFPTFAAKQWHYFSVGGRHFLALAQGVDAASAESRNPSRSAIFEWDGQQFRSLGHRLDLGLQLAVLPGGR